MRTLRVLAVALPALLAAVPLGEEDRRPAPPPPAHAVDIWMEHIDRQATDPLFARAQEESLLRVGAPGRFAAAGAGSPFQVVGSVAVLEGDDVTTARVGTRFGVDFDHLAAVTTRFIKAFGDNFDQVAVFLTFTDYVNPQSLAHQQPVKNDTQGLGLGAFDHSARFGSPSGRLQSVLNMKRISVYGRDAADDEDNSLYYFWAQEAAHRWIVYFRFRRPDDRASSDALLGRQKAHWTREVQADGSIMDGFLWKENGDGTYTPVERGKRYGILDQYGMGLRKASEVPPFYFLEDLVDELDRPVDKGPIARGARYKAKRVDVTIEDIVRANGARKPETDLAAQDLRMGVVLLTPPGVPTEQVIGESFRIDLTRRLWTDFYNAAGGGRGKVCTELLRPCRGPAFTFSDPVWSEAGKTRDGLLAPGDELTLKVTVTNAGSERGTARLRADGRGMFSFAKEVDVGPLMPGQSAAATFEGRALAGAACGQPLTLELETIDTSARPNPSKGTLTTVLGLVAGPLEDLEGASPWRVNPDGTDTADAGRWEVGMPERTEAFDFVLQPGSVWSGKRALVTGAARGGDPSANDVHGGKTTVESPPLPLAGLSDPRLSYQVYFVAADFDRELLFPGGGDSLRVLASADGRTWTEVDRVTGMAIRWERRIVRLADKLPPEALGAASLRLRFVAEDAGTLDNIVEAVVDDVGLFGESPACSLPPPEGVPPVPTDDGGCGCHLASNASHSSVPLLLTTLFALLLLGRRPRSPLPGSGRRTG